ncbi:MAG: hypothetical protein IT323_07570, partial [Anaerolineae bacterium]|nr:hypothetical protein [Anaerolineae bacterium]
MDVLSQSETSGAPPSAPFVPHPPIAPGACLGRAAERSSLAAWAASDNPLLVLDGPGGIGKTALVWRWFTIEAPGQIPDLAGLIWWDFAESDAAPDTFIRRTLAYVTGTEPDSLHDRPLAACQADLLAELRRRPHLIVLDSAERLLGAYYRMDAAYLTEDKVAQEAASGDPRPRRCADPEHGALLVQLAGCAPSRVAVVTRLFPADLQHTDGRPRPGVQNLNIGALAPDDAHSLLSSLDVRGSQEAFVQVAALADHHPFLLRIIAADARRRSHGILDRWAAEVGRDFARFAPMLRRPALVRAALDNLPSDPRRALNQIAGFRFPVGSEALIAASPLAPPLPPRASEPRRWQAGYSQAKAAWDAYQDALREREAAAQQDMPRLEAALQALDDAGLLRLDADRDRYDLHPVVRGYAFAFLEAAELEDIFARIRYYYEAQPTVSGDAVRTLADVRPRIEVYHALISAGRLDEAAEHYRAALGRALLGRITTPHQIIELLRPLFPGGPGTLPALSNPRDQGYFAN